MSLRLTLHPDSRCQAVTQIEVEATCSKPGTLQLRYVVTGDISVLRLPPVTAPARADELWRHTCFEAFVQQSPGPAYYEFNFAPSTRWAAYAFTDYRENVRVVDEIGTPRIEPQSGDGMYELEAVLELNSLAGLPADMPWRLGLSAVIEDVSGRISYWALAHPPGKPDFHHSDGFALEIPPVKSR